MCIGSKPPKAPPPLPPPKEDAVFQPGSAADLDSLSISGGAKDGKKSLTTDRARTGLSIPSGV